MSYIECYSHMTGKNVKYNLIGVKLKHQKRNQDYGCSTDNYNNVYCNTSPYQIASTYDENGTTVNCNIWGTSGFKTQGSDASGILTAEYHNSNTGRNPVISSRTYKIEEMDSNVLVEDLFSTDTVKVRLRIVKKPARAVFYTGAMWQAFSMQKIDGTYEDKENLELITNIVLEYILLSNDQVIGRVDYLNGKQGVNVYPTRFTMNSELFNIIDFDPKYESILAYDRRYSMWFSVSQTTNKGIMVNGSKSTEKHDFTGLIHSLVIGDGAWAYRNGYTYKEFSLIKDGGETLTDRELNVFNVNGDILYFRDKIQNDPNTMIQFNGENPLGGVNGVLYFTPTEQAQWISNYMSTKGYLYRSVDGDSTSMLVQAFEQSPILMPMYNDMFVPLTNDIKEGTAPDPDPDPEEEELTEAIDGDTNWSADQSDGERNYFNHVTSDTIGGDPGAINLYPAGYSNFIFKYFRPVSGASDKLVAYKFIIDTMVAGTSDALHSFFKLVLTEPKMSTILGRVYALPFEYDEIYDQSAGIKECCPSYGIMGKCLGTPAQDPLHDGFSNYHYYDRLVQRFKVLDLGTTTVSKIFLNYLDYVTRYTLNLPYAGGEVDIDPSFLFRNKATSGTISLKGYLDFDTGFMVIKVNVNGDLYYETTVNVATDLAVSMTDYGTQMAALGRAVILAGTAGIMKSGVASTMGRGLKTIGNGLKKFIPTTTIEPLPDIPPLGLPEKDIIYGEDKTAQRFGEWVMDNWQQNADIPKIGLSNIDFFQGRKPTLQEYTDYVWNEMLAKSRWNQRVADVTYPYCEVYPSTPLGRRL